MVKCICINDKNCPPDFPNKDLWVKEGENYTIINVLWIQRSNTLGVQLNEIDLSNNEPYTFFDAKRFAIAEEDREEFENLVQASKEIQEMDSDFSDVQINHLLEENLHKTVEKELEHENY